MENRDTLNVEMKMEFDSMTNEGEKFMEVFGEIRNSFNQIAGALSRISVCMEEETQKRKDEILKEIKENLENSNTEFEKGESMELNKEESK